MAGVDSEKHRPSPEDADGAETNPDTKNVSDVDAEIVGDPDDPDMKATEAKTETPPDTGTDSLDDSEQQSTEESHKGASSFIERDGKWFTTITTSDGESLEVEFMAGEGHDEDLKAQILGMKLGDEPIVRKREGVSEDGKPVVFENRYEMTPEGLVMAYDQLDRKENEETPVEDEADEGLMDDTWDGGGWDMSDSLADGLLVPPTLDAAQSAYSAPASTTSPETWMNEPVAEAAVQPLPETFSLAQVSAETPSTQPFEAPAASLYGQEMASRETALVGATASAEPTSSYYETLKRDAAKTSEKKPDPEPTALDTIAPQETPADTIEPVASPVAVAQVKPAPITPPSTSTTPVYKRVQYGPELNPASPPTTEVAPSQPTPKIETAPTPTSERPAEKINDELPAIETPDNDETPVAIVKPAPANPGPSPLPASPNSGGGLKIAPEVSYGWKAGEVASISAPESQPQILEAAPQIAEAAPAKFVEIASIKVAEAAPAIAEAKPHTIEAPAETAPAIADAQPKLAEAKTQISEIHMSTTDTPTPVAEIAPAITETKSDTAEAPAEALVQAESPIQIAEAAPQTIEAPQTMEAPAEVMSTTIEAPAQVTEQTQETIPSQATETASIQVTEAAPAIAEAAPASSETTRTTTEVSAQTTELVEVTSPVTEAIVTEAPAKVTLAAGESVSLHHEAAITEITEVAAAPAAESVLETIAAPITAESSITPVATVTKIAELASAPAIAELVQVPAKIVEVAIPTVTEKTKNVVAKPKTIVAAHHEMAPAIPQAVTQETISEPMPAPSNEVLSEETVTRAKPIPATIHHDDTTHTITADGIEITAAPVEVSEEAPRRRAKRTNTAHMTVSAPTRPVESTRISEPRQTTELNAATPSSEPAPAEAQSKIVETSAPNKFATPIETHPIPSASTESIPFTNPAPRLAKPEAASHIEPAQHAPKLPATESVLPDETAPVQPHHTEEPPNQIAAPVLYDKVRSTQAAEQYPKTRHIDTAPAPISLVAETTPRVAEVAPRTSETPLTPAAIKTEAPIPRPQPEISSWLEDFATTPGPDDNDDWRHLLKHPPQHHASPTHLETSSHPTGYPTMTQPVTTQPASSDDLIIDLPDDPQTATHRRPARHASRTASV